MAAQREFDRSVLFPGETAAHRRMGLAGAGANRLGADPLSAHDGAGVLSPALAGVALLMRAHDDGLLRQPRPLAMLARATGLAAALTVCVGFWATVFHRILA